MNVTVSFPKTQDSKVCGEAGTQPSLRLPPLREGRHVKLLQAAISLRFCKESGAMQPGDGVLLLDGGRDGSSAQLLSIKMANA